VELDDGAPIGEIVAGVDADLARGRSAGEIVSDPAHAAVRPRLTARSGRRFPGAGHEASLVTRAFLDAEVAVAELVRAAPGVPLELGPGVFVAPAGHDHLETADRLYEVARQACADRRSIVLVAPSRRGLDRLEALTGLVAHLADAPRPAGRPTVVLVADAQLFEPGALLALTGEAELGAAVVLAPSDLAGGRAPIVDALAVGRLVDRHDHGRPSAGHAGPGPAPPHPGRVVAFEAPATSFDRARPDVRVRLVDRPAALADAVRSELEAGAAAVVTGDPAIARALAIRGVATVAPASPAALTAALDDRSSAPLVVVGGLPGRGRTRALVGDRPATYVIVAPPERDPATLDHWLARVRSPVGRSFDQRRSVERFRRRGALERAGPELGLG
jgi:hypothetical protein